jgi:hypothetical protein
MEGRSLGAYRIYDGREKMEPFVGYPGRIVERPVDQESASLWAASRLPDVFVSTVRFDAGTWTAPLPDGIPEESANLLDVGVLPEPPLSEWLSFEPDEYGPEMTERITESFGCAPEDLVVVAKRSLVLFAADWIVEHLSRSSSGVGLVLEMNSQQREDAVVWMTAMGAFYPVASGDRDSLADLMDSASSSWGECAILTSATLDPATPASLSSPQLEDLVARADEVVLGAYDGEGYLRWRRR